MAITNTVASLTTIIRGLIEDKLRTDGRDSEIYQTDNVFYLTEDFPSSTTITVWINGVETSSFTYDSDNNGVTVSASLTIEDIVLIKYSYYKKYSDTEISGFLESSLAYFPQYQYKKTFTINTDNNVVAVNGYDPTTEELYFIALIASIVIDPQNIRVNIPDLNISAKRDMSDQDQIKTSFANFKNFIGTVSFEDLDPVL